MLNSRFSTFWTDELRLSKILFAEAKSWQNQTCAVRLEVRLSEIVSELLA